VVCVQAYFLKTYFSLNNRGYHHLKIGPYDFDLIYKTRVFLKTHPNDAMRRVCTKQAGVEIYSSRTTAVDPTAVLNPLFRRKPAARNGSEGGRGL
jgi:hypothetical protein